jgi:dipeptidyl aminopeptidase/acylaminoacyl peptidase
MRGAVVAVAIASAIGMLWTAVAQAAFPGSNGKIIYVKDTDASTEADELYTINPDGTNETRLTTNSTGDDGPAWSADGSRIAWRTFNRIAVMNIDGSGGAVISPPGLISFDPTWSPDGTRLAFTGEPGGTCCTVMTMNSDGSNVQQFSQLNDDGGANWSPDGHTIVFHSDFAAFGFTTEIYTKRVDELVDPVRITNNTFIDVLPNWSPDGSKIVFESFRNNNQDIYVMDSDGSNEMRLTFDAASDIEPAWSPDGSKIAFVSTRDGTNEIYVMNADGSGQTRVTGDTQDDFEPDWQPIPNRPPDCSTVRATPDSLSPPNRSFRVVALDGATDPDGDALTLTIDGVTQDEPLRGQGDHTSPDAILSDDGSVLRLRAESRRRGDGRVYRIAFTASDGRGGTCSGTASVEVPRRRGVAAIDSAPPSYDSLGG